METSIPESQTAATSQSEVNSPIEPETLHTKVNTLIDGMVKDKQGKWQFQDSSNSISEELKFAAMAERRRRDSQTAVQEKIQSEKALKAEKKILEEKLEDTIQLNLTGDEKDRLDELKYSDPDAYIFEKSKLEKEYKAQRKEQLNQELADVKEKTLEETRVEYQKTALKEFSNRVGYEITQDMIRQNVPFDLVNSVDNGKISFEEFLNLSHQFISTPKAMAQAQPLDSQPNLNKISGSYNPNGLTTQKEDINAYYKKAIY